MNNKSAFLPPKIAAIEEFGELRTRAQMDFFHHWFTSTPALLERFEDGHAPARRTIGIREIPVDRIVGSVDRSDDFDRCFRPLKRHLRDRWVNIYLAAERGGWPPIRVWKSGEAYFVEDGHHRVSVARARGMLTIPAEVVEFAAQQPAACAMATRRYGDLPCADAS